MTWIEKLHKVLFPKSEVYQPKTVYNEILPIARQHYAMNFWETKVVRGEWYVEVNGKEIAREDYKNHIINVDDVVKIILNFGRVKWTVEYVMC